MLNCDLHIHTTASDGVLTPSKVVLRAKEKGVNLLAITDHDALSGIDEARACGEDCGVQVLPGVELSTGGKAEIHVLGYGVDERNPALVAFLEGMRRDRRERAQRILKRLEEMHLPVDLPQVADGASVGRPLIARAMMGKGYVASVQEAFERYLGSGRPAYVPRTEVDTTEAVRLLRSIGAVPVLAHPCQVRMDLSRLLMKVQEWIDNGLMGIEIYHPSMSEGDRAMWRQIAKKNQLLTTGGSDFHAVGDKHADIGKMSANWKNCNEDALKLLCAMEKAKGNKC